MRPFNIALRIISIYIFPIFVVWIFLILGVQTIDISFKHCITWFLLLFIIINWISWGIWGGIVGFIITILVNLYAWMLKDDFMYPVVLAPAGLLFFILYINEERAGKDITLKKLEIDEKERDYNLLLQENKKQENARDSYYKKAKRFGLLSQIAKELGFVLTPDEIKRNVISSLAKTIENGDVYSLWGMKPDLEDLELLILESPVGAIFPETVSPDEFNMWVMRNRQPLIVTDITKDYRFNTADIMKKTRTRSLIMSPLITGDRMQGIIRIDSYKPDAFSVDDLRLLAIISNMGALTIYNSQLYKQTEYLAIRDDLTGLYVKGYFRETLEKLIIDAQIKRTIFFVLLLDLDRFKDLNDQYGHSVGDKVLKRVAELIMDAVQVAGIAARYGGEEFAVILRDVTKPDAVNIAENIRRLIEEQTFSIRREGIKTTISIGISEFPADGDTHDKLIEKADRCLYEAKRKGRNRVIK